MHSKSYNITDLFIDGLFDIDVSYLTTENVNKVRDCLIDYYAATYSGISLISKKLDYFLSESENHSGAYTVIGSGKKATLENAIFLNGLISHVAELDDGSRFGMIHPGAPIFSALLPLALKHDVSFSSFVLGVLTGYECSIRLSMAIAPSHYNLGYHPTATCGTLGTAVAIAKMLQFSKSDFKNALSSASISASGSLKVIEDESEIKPFNVAKASLNALFSARIAKVGFNGGRDSLGGENGFLNMMSTEWDESKLLRAKSDKLLIHSVYFKPYAACRHAHAPIEAAVNIRPQILGCFDEIDTITVYTYKGVIGKHDSNVIGGTSSAKMSIPYSVSVSLVTGNADISKFTEEWIHDNQIRELLCRVIVTDDPTFTSLVPEKRCAKVDILMKSGRIYSDTVEYPKGEPENPMSFEELLKKLRLSLIANKEVLLADFLNLFSNLEKNFKILLTNNFN